MGKIVGLTFPEEPKAKKPKAAPREPQETKKPEEQK